MCTNLTIEEQLEKAKQAGFKPDETIDELTILLCPDDQRLADGGIMITRRFQIKQNQVKISQKSTNIIINMTM